MEGVKQTLEVYRSVRVHVSVDKVVVIADRCRQFESAELLMGMGTEELRKVGVTVAERIPRVRGYRWAPKWFVQRYGSRDASV